MSRTLIVAPLISALYIQLGKESNTQLENDRSSTKKLQFETPTFGKSQIADHEITRTITRNVIRIISCRFV
ncbi:MAG TPA: hypothetical protein VJ521_06795, partial [Acidobacteriota bacterium]|nr:hypothetical protein [Acidobacteriota bacterium]